MAIHNSEIIDNQLMHMLQKYLRKHPSDKLDSIYYCGSKVIKQLGATPAVFVVSNGEQSQLFGANFCHSSWACPRCTANTMAKYGARIASVIDALATWHKQSAFMATFTIPHSNKLSADTIFKILLETWRRFSRAGNNKGHIDKARNEKYNTHGKRRGNDPYGAFREELGIRHNVRVIEFTWSEKNGWHPHIHALFWVPTEKFHQVMQYADSLNDRWWDCARQASVKILSQIYERGDRLETQSRVNQYFADWRKNPKTGHRSVYFSTDAKGELIVQKSSRYISGWTGDMEVTSGYHKLGRNGHYSPYQLLQLAKANPKDRDKYLALYVEYAEATRGHRRFHFSKSGLNELVKKWRLTQIYIEQTKKKFMARVAGKYHVVCWFNEQQWSEISSLSRELDECLISRILTLARLPDGNQRITQLLAQYDIDVSANATHKYTQIIEDIFNPAA